MLLLCKESKIRTHHWNSTSLLYKYSTNGWILYERVSHLYFDEIFLDFCMYFYFQKQLYDSLDNFAVRRQSTNSVARIQDFKFPKSLRRVGVCCLFTLVALAARGALIIVEYIHFVDNNPMISFRVVWWQWILYQVSCTLVPGSNFWKIRIIMK